MGLCLTISHLGFGESDTHRLLFILPTQCRTTVSSHLGYRRIETGTESITWELSVGNNRIDGNEHNEHHISMMRESGKIHWTRQNSSQSSSIFKNFFVILVSTSRMYKGFRSSLN